MADEARARIRISAQNDTDPAFKKALGNVQALQSKIEGVAAKLGGAFALYGLTTLVQSSINAADNLKDLSAQTGITVEVLGGLGFAASQSGGSLESIAGAAGKLNKTLAEAASGSRQALEPFQLLGISIQDAAGQTVTADEAIARIAERFAAFADGPQKSALALRLFGKSGADIIPLLNDGGAALRENIAYYQRFSGVTSEVAAQADQFNDTMGKIRLISGAVGTTLAAQLLPTMQRLADALLGAKEESAGLEIAAQALGGALKAVTLVAYSLATGLTVSIDQMAALGAGMAAVAKGDLSGAIAIGRAAAEQREEAGRSVRAMFDRLYGDPGRETAYDRAAARLKRQSGSAGAPKPAAPRLADTGAASEAQATLKRALDAQLAEIRRFADAQRDAYEFANAYAAGEYESGLVALRDYLGAQSRLRNESLAATVSALDREIQVQRAAAAKMPVGERQEIEVRIADAVGKRAAAVTRASQEEILANQAAVRSLDQVRRQYDDVRAAVLQLSGDETGAARLRIEQQVSDAGRTITAAGGDQGLAVTLGSKLRATEELRQSQAAYNRLLQQTRNAEESILLAAQQSGSQEVDVLRAVGAVRQQALGDLDAMTVKARELADALGTDEARAFADALALGLQRATAEADPLLTRLREISGDIGAELAGGFEDAVVEGKNLRETLQGISRDIVRIVTQQAVTKPLTQSISNAISGGGGGWLAKLLGLAGASAGPQISSMGTASLIPGFAGGGSTGDGPRIGGLDGYGGYLAMVHPQEVVIDRTRGQSVSGQNITINVQNAPGMSRESGNQLGARIARELRMSDAYNN